MLLRVEIAPQTAFGSPILGETLFGQFCWAVRALYGEERLTQWLEGYTDNHPFTVISDAFPHGYVPLPSIPSFIWEVDQSKDRKYLKSKQWIHFDSALTLPLALWQKHSLTNAELPNLNGQPPIIELPRMHNTISRTSNTTGTNQFAPYISSQIWFNENLNWDIYVVIDERLSMETVKDCFEYIGMTGFGRDASIGLGKFNVIDIQKIRIESSANSFMTLASSAPCGMDLSPQSYYRCKTHFGRHGHELAHSANPFKKPLLLAQCGAVFTLKTQQKVEYLGQGISGLSAIQPQAVHQGYAPVLPIIDLG